MNIFYVCQNKSQKQESTGQYLWSPQKAKNGSNNQGYMNMTLVKKGDIIFHGAKQTTYAISIAKDECYKAMQPEELKRITNNELWNDEGYRIDADYKILTTPVEMRPLFSWFKNHYNQNSAFTVMGECKQIYLNLLAVEHAKFIVTKALELHPVKDVKVFLNAVLEIILDEKNSEYDDIEFEEINDLIDEISKKVVKPTWKGKAGTQKFTNSTELGSRKPKRKPHVAANALLIADNYCEFDKTDRTFLRKNGIRYTEPHHLVPISKYNDFEFEKGNLEILMLKRILFHFVVTATIYYTMVDLRIRNQY